MENKLGVELEAPKRLALVVVPNKLADCCGAPKDVPNVGAEVAVPKDVPGKTKIISIKIHTIILTNIY